MALTLTLFLLGLLATVLTGVGTAAMVGRARHYGALRRHLRIAKKQPPLTHLEADDAGQVVFVRGRLVLTEVDGQRVARVAIGELEPGLAGPFAILTGTSHAAYSGPAEKAATVSLHGRDLRLSHARGAVRQYLEDGDEVVVHARFHRSVQHSRGYRHAPTETWWLGEKKRRSSISDANAKPTARDIPSIFRRRFSTADLGPLETFVGLLASGLLAALLATGALAHARFSSCKEQCGSRFECGLSTRFDGGPFFRCGGNEGHCAASILCSDFGKCSGDWGEPCIPATDSHCEESAACEELGACTRVTHDGGLADCRVTSDADCEGSKACQQFGKCQFSSRLGGTCTEAASH